jgi:putative transposase
VPENLDAGSAKTKDRFIEKEAEPYTVTRLCKFLGVSRSGYSAFLKRKDNDPDESIMTLTMKVYTKHDGKYGYRQIQMIYFKTMKSWSTIRSCSGLCKRWGSALEYVLNVARATWV